MDLTGEIVLGAPRRLVWDALNDPQVLAACIPGCESVEVVSPTEKTARVMIKVGPVRARFSGRILLSDIVDAESCSMSFEGSGGAAGMARGKSKVQLFDEAEQQTRLRYTVQAAVAGKLGQVGGRMIDAAAKQMADQFFAAFRAHLTPDAEGVKQSAVSGLSGPVLESERVGSPGARIAPASGLALRTKWFALGAASSAIVIWIVRLF